MKTALSLATRTFLFSFLSMCLVLVMVFFTINAVIKEKIKEGLKETLHRAEKVQDKAEAEYYRRNNQLIAILSENAGLKAGIGLLQEGPADQVARLQIRKTIEAQLHELGNPLDYDLLMITDPDGQVVAALGGKDAGRVQLDSILVGSSTSSLISLEGTLYQATTVPINLNSENLGSLTVGNKFDMGSLNSFGYTALLKDNKVVLTTAPSRVVGKIEQQLQARCGQQMDGCEISFQGETYLTLLLGRAHLGEKYKLLSLQSIDRAMGEFTHRLERVFMVIGACGVAVSVLLAAIASRSISSPLSDLIARLLESERTGRLRTDYHINSSAKEVNLLAEAFNRAARAVCESQKRLDEAYLQFIETMAQALDARDPYTAGHSTRVSLYSTSIAQAMGLPADQVQIIDIGARLHDIGKIGIPDAVLQKPGRLTDQEFGLIKLHPQIGKKILEKVGRFQDYLPIVELHHEDYNGRGYPLGLKGEEIPLNARIVHVADVYDAITSDRSYRKAMSVERVLELLESGSGTQFDPNVIEVFLSVLHKWEQLGEASFAVV